MCSPAKHFWLCRTYMHNKSNSCLIYMYMCMYSTHQKKMHRNYCVLQLHYTTASVTTCMWLSVVLDPAVL